MRWYGVGSNDGSFSLFGAGVFNIETYGLTGMNLQSFGSESTINFPGVAVGYSFVVLIKIYQADPGASANVSFELMDYSSIGLTRIHNEVISSDAVDSDSAFYCLFFHVDSTDNSLTLTGPALSLPYSNWGAEVTIRRLFQ